MFKRKRRVATPNLHPIQTGRFTMSPIVQALGIDRLSRDQRIALVLEIWDTIAAEPQQPLLTEAQRRELERRIAEDDANPDDVVPWEQVKTAGPFAAEAMTLPLVFRPAAQAEFDSAAAWYEGQSPGFWAVTLWRRCSKCWTRSRGIRSGIRWYLGMCARL